LYVTLRLRDPAEGDAFRAFLEKRECHVQALADDLLRVGPPHELHEQQARLEVDLYLRVWEALHDSRIDIVP
jgi:hypothetical protein